jgi:hypothetical protein
LQVGFYDNGIGPDESRSMRALGGAAGYGLVRNVRCGAKNRVEPVQCIDHV